MLSAVYNRLMEPAPMFANVSVRQYPVLDNVDNAKKVCRVYLPQTRTKHLPSTTYRKSITLVDRLLAIIINSTIIIACIHLLLDQAVD